MKIIYLKFILILLLSVILAFNACKKSEEDPLVPQKTCKIIMPADSALIQVGNLILIEAEASGFGEQMKVAFSIDSIQMFETGEKPYDFKFDTKGWKTGAYIVRADAYMGMELASDEITIILIDTIIPPHPPVAVINITPEEGTTDTIFTFDASQSYDENDALAKLLFRWDFEGDGAWDTDFSHQLIHEYKYSQVGHYYAVLEVMDTDSMTADTIKSIVAYQSSTPDPCEGYVSIPYGGKIYHLVPIGNQCWLRENLDIGQMIAGGEKQTNNQTIEKYCYKNDSLNCEKYGGLYMWREMMNYFPVTGARGICPTGFHIPSDDEWKELEGYTDSQYGIGDPEWDNNSFRGSDAGRQLKAMLGWNSGGNGSNLYGFKAKASGYWESGITFVKEGEEAHFWSSKHDSGQNAIERELKYDEDGISRTFHWDEAAFSVRCIRN